MGNEGKVSHGTNLGPTARYPGPDHIPVIDGEDDKGVIEMVRLSNLRLAALAALLLIGRTNASEEDFDDEIYSVIDSYRDGSLWTRSRQARSVDVVETPRNESFSDNSLWNDLWSRCKKKPSFACIKSGVFKYLDRNLDGPDDLELTDHMFFRKNRNKYEDVCENSSDERDRCLRYQKEKLKLLTDQENDNEVTASERTPALEKEVVSGVNNTNSTGETVLRQQEEEDIMEGAFEGRSIDALSDLSDILYDKGTKFLMTHDLEFELPQTFFGGGSVKIEPKTFDFGSDEDDGEEGTVVKIVFKPPPPPAQVVRGRVLQQLKKLFKKKLMHSFMALMLIIKMIKVKLMFLLPMIIGQNTAKRLLLKTLLFLIPGLAHLFKLCHFYHMEHAKYHHHYHKIKHHHHTVKVPVPVPVPVHHHHHEGDFAGYPSNDYPSYPPAPYPPYPPQHSDHEYDYQPSGSSHSVYGQYPDNEAAMASWGLGSHNYQDAGVLDAKDQPAYSGYNDYYKKTPYGPPSYPDSSYYSNDIVPDQKQFYGSKLQLYSQKPGSGLNHGPDPFYSPIIQKIDGVFLQMGYADEGCRERLVCSMYKNPLRFSPHSNILSNELSRDTLQKPIANNEDVLRFYRYVQAARDGQEQKDCLHLYSSCHVNTEG